MSAGERWLSNIPALTVVRVIRLQIDAATAKRIRAHIERVERDAPGCGYDPDESDTDSFRIAIGALVDRGLAESEADDGMIADMMTGELRPRRRDAVLARRVRRAWDILRRGW